MKQMTEPKYACAWLDHRVSYGETDAMTVLYHSEYIHIFERARGQLARDCHCPYKEIEEQGIMLPVTEVHCHYLAPARYDDLLRVKACVADWGRASVRFVYEVWNEDKSRKLAEGESLHAVTDLTGKAVRIPDWLRNAFK